jgi:glycosyltransferase involved in cell wall biosynthesis
MTKEQDSAHRTKTIACLVDSLAAGGAQNQLLHLAKGLSDRGHDVQIFVFHNIPHFQKTFGHKLPPVRLLEIPQNKILRFTWLVRTIWSVLKFRPDVVIAFLPTPSFVGACLKLFNRRIKVISSIRVSSAELLGKMGRFIYRHQWQKFDHITANNQEIISDFRARKFHVERIVHIPNGTPTSPCVGVDTAENGKIHLSMLSGYYPLKGQHTLLVALSQIPKRVREKIKVQCFGNIIDEKYFASLVQQSKEQGLDSIIEFRDATNSSTVLKSTHALIHCATSEGCPNAVLEAWAHGRPVVAPNIEAIRTIADQRDTVLFKADDPTDLANALVYLADLSWQDLRTMGLHGRERVAKNFSIENMVNEYEKLIVT